MRSPQSRARKTKEGEAGIDLTHQETWGRYLSIAFDGLAALTGHDHWSKSDAELDLVAIPAARIAREQVPKEVLERMQRGQNWVALFVGIALLVLPSLLTEWRLWREAKQPVARGTTATEGAREPARATAYAPGSNGTIPEANPRSASSYF